MKVRITSLGGMLSGGCAIWQYIVGGVDTHRHECWAHIAKSCPQASNPVCAVTRQRERLGYSKAKPFVCPMQVQEFQSAVLNWFDREGRKNLPWQTDPTPYRVWVSEIMLQQTQVSSVIPYFLRFTERFPNLRSLALAPEEEVLGHWAGLGYYARARNLRKTALILLECHGGEFPANVDTLAGLPGIGRSTAGAIASLALGLRAPILDGNVKRVISRFAAVQGWPGEAKISRELWRISENFTPTKRVADYTQAMMDLGATLCTRSSPNCTRCPLQNACLAFRLKLTKELPSPRPKKDMPEKRCLMLVLCDGNGWFYLEKRPPAGIWGGLWSFPQFDSHEELAAWCQMRNVNVALDALPERRHTFSHYHLDYLPMVGWAAQPLKIAESNLEWLKPEDNSPLPTPVRRLMLELGQFDAT